MVKTSSLAVLIGVVEVIKVGQQIIENSLLTVPSASLWIYGFIFILYFLICYPLSRLAAHLEKVWSNYAFVIDTTITEIICTKSYLQGIDLDVEQGEVVVILGPSGCGKSTLLRCINGLEPIQGGKSV